MEVLEEIYLTAGVTGVLMNIFNAIYLFKAFIVQIQQSFAKHCTSMSLICFLE
jgi:hypothetical protein